VLDKYHQPNSLLTASTKPLNLDIFPLQVELQLQGIRIEQVPLLDSSSTFWLALKSLK